jgi:hypothetical protein
MRPIPPCSVHPRTIPTSPRLRDFGGIDCCQLFWRAVGRKPGFQRGHEVSVLGDLHRGTACRRRRRAERFVLAAGPHRLGAFAAGAAAGNPGRLAIFKVGPRRNQLAVLDRLRDRGAGECCSLRRGFLPHWAAAKSEIVGGNSADSPSKKCVTLLRGVAALGKALLRRSLGRPTKGNELLARDCKLPASEGNGSLSPGTG